MAIKIEKNIFLYFSLLSIALGGFLFSTFLTKPISFYVFIISASLSGFLVASYIFYKKHFGKELVCPVGSSCNQVIYSPYSKFFGIHLEYLGMAYYATIFASYLGYIIAPGAFGELFRFGVLALTGGAFLFSLYLLFVQGFILKQWCMWCLLSSVLSITIFIVSIGSFSIADPIIASLIPTLLVTHFFGFAFGVGGITIVTFLFFKFLKDYKISDTELNTLRTISEIIWFALALVIITQFALYVPNEYVLNQSEQFLTKIIAIGVTVLCGAALSLVLSPYVNAISFEEGAKNSATFSRLRKLVFSISAVSFTSWYTAFALTILPDSGQGSYNYLWMYLGGVIVVIFASLYIEKRLSLVTNLFNEGEGPSIQV